jgi:predicted phosphodiesterase
MFTKSFDNKLKSQVVRSFSGVLFIGDPHVCSKKIGRRKDDYLSSVLEKLAHCAQLCEDFNLLPVILGDLLHRSYDNSLSMLNRVTRVLKQFPTVPLVLDGNHDTSKTTLSDDDALQVLSLSGTVQTIDNEGEVGVFEINGVPVRIWGCRHGKAIPQVLPEFEGPTILLTHHDLGFESDYPGSQPLRNIENCQMVVNGHMHDTKPAQQLGATWWHNPGNIEPLSVDLAGHIPRAWLWTPETEEGTLQGLDLPHGTDLFDLNGLQVAAADADLAVQALTQSIEDAAPLGPMASQFSALIKAQSETDAQKTGDASVLAADLTEVLQTATVSPASRLLMQSLMDTLTKSAQLTD